MKLYLTLFSFLIIANTLTAQKKCADNQATNYNINASCQYKKTKKRFKRTTKLDEQVNETSGLFVWNNGVWTINDSGGEPALYKTSPETGKVTQIVSISNAVNIDWEELSHDDNHIYIGDMGNNRGYRKDLSIYTVKKSDINISIDSQSVIAQKLTFYYPEQKDFNHKKIHHFDCEGFFYYKNQFHLFTKNRDNAKTYHYTVPNEVGNHAAKLQDSLDVRGQITAADIQDGHVVLLGYTPGKLFMWILWDYEGEDFFTGNRRRIELGRFFWRGQMEGICFTNALNGYISAEGTPIKKQHLRRFSIEKWVRTNLK
ncbi:MAG: hypothetical protein ACPGXZ_12425 [Saprospiraceae bacterium]